jgi:hypothetical protein
MLIWLFPAATLAQRIGDPVPTVPPMQRQITVPNIPNFPPVTSGPTFQQLPSTAPSISVPQAAAGAAGGPPQASGGGKQKLRKCSCYVRDQSNNSWSKVGCEPRCCTESPNAEPCD